MVEVDDVLHLQLPVRPRGVELGALDDFHAVAALVGEIVEITRHVSEVGHQIGCVRIETDKDELPVALEARHLLEVEVLAPESAGVSLLGPHRMHLACVPERPRVVHAVEDGSVALGFAAQLRAAMGTGIDKRANASVVAPAEDDRP